MKRNKSDVNNETDITEREMNEFMLEELSEAPLPDGLHERLIADIPNAAAGCRNRRKVRFVRQIVPVAACFATVFCLTFCIASLMRNENKGNAATNGSNDINNTQIGETDRVPTNAVEKTVSYVFENNNVKITLYIDGTCVSEYADGEIDGEYTYEDGVLVVTDIFDSKETRYSVTENGNGSFILSEIQ